MLKAGRTYASLVGRAVRPSANGEAVVKIFHIIWLDPIVDKLRRKHTVEPKEVEEALASHPHFFFAEKGHREGEHVYGAFGQSEAGRYLVVYLIYKVERNALIVSARDMAPKDRRRYGRR